MKVRQGKKEQIVKHIERFVFESSAFWVIQEGNLLFKIAAKDTVKVEPEIGLLFFLPMREVSRSAAGLRAAHSIFFPLL